MNKYILIGALVALIGVTGLYFLSGSTTDKQVTPILNPSQDNLINKEIEEKSSSVNIESIEEPIELITTSETNTVIGTLTYSQDKNYIDPVQKRFTVTLKYSTAPQCDTLTNKDMFTILTGDGTRYSADCKGVVDHMYKASGTYKASYLKNEVEIANVSVQIK